MSTVIPATLFDVPSKQQWPKRPSSARRGYGPRWQRERALFLALHPFCLYCHRRGTTTRSDQVDHCPPHRGDVAQFWNQASWIPACEACHRFASAAFDGWLGNPVRPRTGEFVALRAGELEGGVYANPRNAT